MKLRPSLTLSADLTARVAAFVTALVTALIALALAACGNSGSGSGPDASTTSDACSGLCTDAPPFTGMCTPGGAQCANCIDDDGDGRIDGFDTECTGALDNDESSFSTGIPGDNIDAVKQDCFFDGNSGSGNDGCDIHVCCLLGARTRAECPIGANQYNPNSCPPPIGTAQLSQKCIDTCGRLTPPGCDCFGCCTECVPGSNPLQCYDIILNPSTSPNCNDTNLGDPAACKRCTKSTTCNGGSCGGDSCVLCPGQDPSTLPAGCNGAACPTGIPTCGAGGSCPADTYCANGCCIAVIE